MRSHLILGVSELLITQEQADVLIDYMEVMSEQCNHNTVMTKMTLDGYSEAELDEACKALSAIAGRDFSIK